MNKFTGYRCSLCGAEYSPTEVTYTCSKDGGNLDVVLDYESIKGKYKPEDILSRRHASLWSFLPLLPVSAPPGDSPPLPAEGARGGNRRPQVRPASQGRATAHLWGEGHSGGWNV